MDIHEYQAKEILNNHNIKTLRSVLCRNGEEAYKAYQTLSSPVCAVKAQVHAGGRGKAGGVKIAKSADETRSIAEKMIGMTLVTAQTGKEGKKVRKVLIEEGAEIIKEFYLSLTIDRKTASIAFVLSAEGGMEIEEVSKNAPEKILTVPINPGHGLKSFHMLKMFLFLGIEKNLYNDFSNLVSLLYDTFIKEDMSMLEINPLILTGANTFIPLDAKIILDDNASIRHPYFNDFIDEDEEEPLEVKAKSVGLNYIKLDGNVGCMVNGAGLAMATMDTIKEFGAMPANFLDVGGTADAKRVETAFNILLSDKNVKGIFINIFGGIVKCDMVAEGVVAAAKNIGLKLPVVVRLEGTNADIAAKIIESSGMNFIVGESLADGAKKISDIVNG
ncbi:MAG: ADP-forming succinate--CoA ligase subunit beta [Deltaproteobacteria bacterium]|jgi:succinyl-CoA synthetase beta subunit|nr:ADP-forming succinate--CoA ligase subunit beta [Deltaproteobacteria bacterium]MCL5879279.1 ADP-forming succinate--CoA ligase subunit beta [Deltaproteobacteria bacterium]MDA8304938.1 ADP-forming succinate--CoA ligase subunit beta [Deltaproteobacteria bacterium]